MTAGVNFGLAPMEGVSDFPFRLWMSQTSAPAFMSTPFLRVTDTYPRQLPESFCPELFHLKGASSYALIPQLMAARAQDFVRTADLLLSEAPFVDLNAGCPSPNPISSGAGSGLLRDTDHFLRFGQEIARSLGPGCLSIKMRSGFDDTTAFSSQIDGLATLPLRQLTVHGRTRRDRYDHQSRWDLIRWAADQVPFPVVASGDIVSWSSWQQRAAFGLDRVIIGRGALRNPWLFTELRTQAPVDIDRELLLRALAVYGLLLELERRAPERLVRLVLEGCFLSSAGTSRDAWTSLYERLLQERAEPKPTKSDAIAFEPFIMGRLKMLWNSLRSSLPAAFSSPLLLRAKSFGDWVSAWRTLWPEDQALPLRHQAEWDWLYTSSRKRPATALSFACADAAVCSSTAKNTDQPEPTQVSLS